LGNKPGLDGDLEAMSRERLIEEVSRLRAGIRRHRNASGHDLCWHHPKLWALLPEKTDPLPVVPTWSEFLAGCIKYRRALDKELPGRVRSVGEYEGEDSESDSVPRD
jgi:hypothetical protein